MTGKSGCYALLLILTGMGMIGLMLYLVVGLAVTLFVAGVVVSIYFAATASRRRAEGQTLGKLVIIPVLLFALSVPMLIYLGVTLLPADAFVAR